MTATDLCQSVAHMRLLLIAAVAIVAAAAPLAPTQLRVQEMPHDSNLLTVVDPADAVAAGMKFTWKNAHTDRGVSQTACRVVVSESRDVLSSTVWDSGVVAHRASTIAYGGAQLMATKSYFWAVQWTDSNGTSRFSGLGLTFL